MASIPRRKVALSILGGLVGLAQKPAKAASLDKRAFIPVVNLQEAYHVQDVGNEKRLFLGEQHFGSIIYGSGQFIFRPHPGLDPNGWGSSLYMQPFFPGALLAYSTLGKVLADADGILVNARGQVSGQVSGQGSWSFDSRFTYAPSTKYLLGPGIYSIKLDGLNEDLNLAKIASNYLVGVPLLSGGIGSTGDLSEVVARLDSTSLRWNITRDSSYFPTNTGTRLEAELVGEFNQVDTAAMGDPTIAAAYKPGLILTFEGSHNISFGAIYDVRKKTDPYADNVGITPLVLKNSTTARSLEFVVTIQSFPPIGDHA